MSKLTGLMKSFVAAEEGVTMIEYALLAALIAVVCIVAITTVGTKLAAIFDYIQGQLVTPAA